MSYREFLEQSEDYRVYLVADDYAEKPYDAGSAPIIKIEGYGYRHSVQHVDTGERPHDADAAIESAIDRWNVRPYGNGWEYFEKYMRAYHGTTQINTFQNQDGDWYIAYDTEQWIRSIGFDDKISPRANYDALPEYNFLVEWEAWSNGDVYGYVVEQREHVYQDRRIHTPSDFRTESTEFDQWEQVDSCWGFYGYTYAAEAAREAYELAKESK